MYEVQPYDVGTSTALQAIQQPPALGRVYAIVPRDHGASGTVVEGTFFINSHPTKILFDSGASHSFISHSFMLTIHIVPEILATPLSVATPLGDSSTLNMICRECVVDFDDLQFSVDLIVLCMSEFDIILGMDWLSSNHVSLDCFAKTVCLRVPGRPDVVVATSRGNPFADVFLAHIEEELQRQLYWRHESSQLTRMSFMTYLRCLLGGRLSFASSYSLAQRRYPVHPIV